MNTERSPDLCAECTRRAVPVVRDCDGVPHRSGRSPNQSRAPQLGLILRKEKDVKWVEYFAKGLFNHLNHWTNYGKTTYLETNVNVKCQRFSNILDCAFKLISVSQKLHFCCNAYQWPIWWPTVSIPAG